MMDSTDEQVSRTIMYNAIVDHAVVPWYPIPINEQESYKRQNGECDKPNRSKAGSIPSLETDPRFCIQPLNSRFAPSQLVSNQEMQTLTGWFELSDCFSEENWQWFLTYVQDISGEMVEPGLDEPCVQLWFMYLDGVGDQTRFLSYVDLFREEENGSLNQDYMGVYNGVYTLDQVVDVCYQVRAFGSGQVMDINFEDIHDTYGQK